MSYVEINKRYTKLAEDICCLSCGGAINFTEPQRGEICVDLGSGRGTDVLRLAEKVGQDGFVYGIDVSEGMLKKSQSSAEKLEIKNVKFIKAELEELPIEERSVDMVISNCTINHAADKQKVWNEVARILKNGGRFVVSDIFSSETVPEEYKKDPQAVAECWGGAVTKDVYLSQLKRAGFKEIEIIEESQPYDKGKIKVSSFTIRGRISNSCCSK
ncbi:MAG: methyltransferase domain-containing protein [Bacteroidales bacterium]|nr:methyltransferase domain-containing protein [Bacteroidales bacterium]